MGLGVVLVGLGVVWGSFEGGLSVAGGGVGDGGVSSG